MFEIRYSVLLCVLPSLRLKSAIMALLGMQDVSVGFGGFALLEHMNFQIEQGERICLLGRNGVGKSTLMKLIAGEIEQQGGVISRKPSLTATCLTQSVSGSLKGTVFDIVSAGLGPQEKILTESHLLVETIVSKMKLDADANIADLSAGVKRRALLAQALVQKPDLLLLDEPTNHFDIETITWLEDFLLRYGGTLIFVSHDRVFVKKLATRIIELDRGRLTSHACNYETYLNRKEAAMAAEATTNALFDKKLAQEEAWIRMGVKARRTREQSRIRILEKMREERSQRKELVDSVRLRQQDAPLSGRLVIEAKNISFGYEPEKPIVCGFSTMIMRGDKVGVIGPNGSGKTTLLRVLLKELAAQKGSVRHGTNLEIAYFDQLHERLDYDKSVYDNIAEGCSTVVINGKARNVIGYLRDFLFTPSQSRNPVANLSGGERNRLLLARLFTQPSNVLVLDEPTNDLDIETLDLLEEFLMDYSGTVLIVSHDREFLNNVATGILAIEDSGVIKEYVGGYDDWLRQSKKVQDPQQPENQSAAKDKPKQTRQRPRKLSFNEKNELETTPALIEKLEAEQLQLHDAMANPDFYKKGASIVTVTARAKELSKQLKDLYTRWQQLEELQP